ncbi:MAG TPA: membrane protein insertase YidC, partial [Myxococcales bacterium]
MKDTNQRLFLAIALWLAVYFAWSAFFGPKKPAQTPAKSVAAAAPPSGAQTAPPPATPTQTAEKSRETARPPTRLVSLETERMRVVATSDGGALQSIQLKGDKWARHKGAKEEAQVDLVGQRAGEPLPFATRIVASDGTEILPADAGYTVARQNDDSVSFRAIRGDVSVLKTLTLNPKTYAVQVSVEVQSASGLTGQLMVLSGAHAEEPSGGFFGSRSNLPARAICLGGNNKVERLAVGAKEPKFESAGAGFAGIDEQYFLSAILAPQGVSASCTLTAQGQKSGSLVAALAVPLQIAPGAPQKLDFGGYAGPKDSDELNAVAKPLAHSIDWGIWQVIAELLLGVMKFFQRVVPPHNWGIAIILLTLAMKAVTFPLQHKSMKSMQEMQRIQPQLEEMKKKYAGDTQRQNVEQMKLFKEHGVNPMGSCLPMIIQMPIWFALYTTLQVSVDLYNEPFIPGWLNDLTARDPYFVLPVAMGITMILTQILTPSPVSNASQKTMGYVMSGFFSLLMLTYPAGLTLYIFTNNILSIVQQVYLRRTMKPPPAGGQTLTVAPKGGGK